MPASFAFLDHPLPLPFSHGGGGGEHLENTWPGFEATVALGYPFLETDTVATSDGVLLALHDTSLDRMTDATGEVSKLTYEQVKTARVGGQEPIPRLDEVFTRWPDLRINIEPKSDQAVDPLVELIRSTGSLDRVCVGSFNDARVRKMRAALGLGTVHVDRRGTDRAAPLRQLGRAVPRRLHQAIRCRLRPDADQAVGVPRDRSPLRRPLSRARHAGPRLDHRRARRDRHAARPRRGRDHDEQADRPQAGARGPGEVDGRVIPV